MGDKVGGGCEDYACSWASCSEARLSMLNTPGDLRHAADSGD